MAGTRTWQERNKEPQNARRLEKVMAKKAAYMGMLTALAFVFSYIESLIPISIGIPGVKLCLANLVVIVALYTIGAKEAFALSAIRIFLAGFTFGSPASMAYSLAGGMLSLLVMVSMKKSKLFSATGVSVLGGVSHNIGQILIAMLVVENAKLLYYLPALILSGTIAGIAVGILASILTKRLENLISSQ